MYPNAKMVKIISKNITAITKRTSWLPESLRSGGGINTVHARSKYENVFSVNINQYIADIKE